MNWHREFKIALLQDDERKISALIESIPQFPTLELKQEAAYLLQAAIERFSEARRECSRVMQEIRKTRQYLQEENHTSFTLHS